MLEDVTVVVLAVVPTALTTKETAVEVLVA
jgi:hypothetical protein